MESNYPESDNEPGHDYFSYRQYINRLFHEYNWRPQSPSESACTSDMESDCSYRSGVKKSEVTPKKTPLHAIQRNPSDTKRNRMVPPGKARQVRQFRKWLLPKTAFATLKELSTPLQTEVTIYPSNQGAKAEIVVNNVTYAAVDHDKNSAKDKASEQALRALIAPSGDLPMEYLAPFAIHKLMTEWKAPALDTSGTETPIMNPTSPETPAPAPADQRTSGRGIQIVQPFLMNVKECNERRMERSLLEVRATADQPAGGNEISTVAATTPVFTKLPANFGMPKVTKTVADLPPDASSYHPGCLFAYMRPQSGLYTDGRYFEGKGSSRKRARLAAAMEACKVLFGVVYDERVAKYYR